MDKKLELDKNMPVAPDPLWPAGVEPRHLSPQQRALPEVTAAFSEVLTDIWHCEKCGSSLFRASPTSSLCKKCFDTEAQNSKLAQKTNADWMEQSKAIGLDLFERQPEETDIEWRIWERYRSFYPLKLPTWTELASMSGCAVATVVKTAQKWSFKVRLVAWARYTDSGIQEARVKAIKEMNQKQLSMAQTIQDKLKVAIEKLQPELLKPGEIVNLFKVATELERKVTTYVDETVANEAIESKGKQVATKVEDLGEIIGVLQQTGLLNNKVIGVEQTTRIIAKDKEE